MARTSLSAVRSNSKTLARVTSRDRLWVDGEASEVIRIARHAPWTRSGPFSVDHAGIAMPLSKSVIFLGNRSDAVHANLMNQKMEP
jgi:hypothetical protein